MLKSGFEPWPLQILVAEMVDVNADQVEFWQGNFFILLVSSFMKNLNEEFKQLKIQLLDLSMLFYTSEILCGDKKG